MKKLILLLIVISIASCKTETKDSYLVSVDASGIHNGMRAYLNALDGRGKEIVLDTAIAVNEKFTFEGVKLQPELQYLTVNGLQGRLPIIVENGDINVTVYKDSFMSSIVSGTKTNAEYTKFNKSKNTYINRSKTLNTEYNTARKNNDSSKVSSITNELIKMRTEFTNLPLDYIAENKNSYVSLILLNDYSNSRGADFKTVENAYNNLTEEFKQTTQAKKVNDFLARERVKYERNKATAVGVKAPEFTAPTIDGKDLTLKDALGKVTIVDFWAAWCGPCRRENPNVVNIYKKYHSKGLEIIGVSLDGRQRQQNPKEAWLKAIKDDNLTWNQVSNLKGFNDPVAKQYNIQSIPAMFVLDENGIIVAKNLRGKALEDKVAELLN